MIGNPPSALIIKVNLFFEFFLYFTLKIFFSDLFPEFLYINEENNENWSIIKNTQEEINKQNVEDTVSIIKCYVKSVEFIAELPNTFLYDNNTYNFSHNRKCVSKLKNQTAINRLTQLINPTENVEE